MKSKNRMIDTLTHLPSKKDADEIRIVGLLKDELLKTEWAKKLFAEMRSLQLDFFKKALVNIDNPDLIYKSNQELMQTLASKAKAEITSGEENLRDIKGPFIIATNHLGDYKAAPINPGELHLKLPIDQIHPFPMYYSPYIPIAEKLDVDISGTHVILPEPLSLIQKASRMVTVADGGIYDLVSQAKSLFERHPQTALVVFPEGGTSGKRNNGGPYDLDGFHTGAFVLASKLGVPVLPVAKYFNPEKGYELGILPAIYVESREDKEYYINTASTSQNDMQNWLNKQISAVI